jgi:hypothetical protein
MEKLKKAKVTVTICPTCKGNGYLKVVNRDGGRQYTNVGTVTRKGNSMKSMIWVGLMMVLLTACTKDVSFDPATSVIKWVITGDKKHAAQ